MKTKESKGGKNKMKLIIHETNCHGCGVVAYNGKEESYFYDDGSWGNIRTAVEKLIEIGFINPNDVVIFDSDNSIYDVVMKYYERNE